MTAAMCEPQTQMLPVDEQNGTTRAFDSVGRVLAQDGTGLPVLAGEGQRNWIYVTGQPGFYYYGEEVEIDEDWIDHAVQAYETMQRRGYEAPVLAEHNSAVTEGLRLGDVVRLLKAKVEGRWALVAEVRWAMGDAHERIEAGQIRYFSPAISAIEDDETGEILEPVISELSVVAAPHQKGSVTHVLASENAMAEGETIEEAIRGMRAGMELLRERADYVYDVLRNREGFDVDRRMGRLKENIKDAEESVYAFADSMGITASEVKMQSTSMEKRIDKLASEVESIAGTVQALAGLADSIKAMTESKSLMEEDEEEKSEINIDVDVEEDEEEDEKAEASEAELAEVKALKFRLGQLELQRDQAVYSQDLPLGSTIELTQGVADLLFSLWRRDRETFGKVIGDAMTKAEQQPITAPVPSPWTTMLGEAPMATEPKGLSDEDLHKDCLAECGGDAAKASKLYYTRKYGV